MKKKKADTFTGKTKYWAIALVKADHRLNAFISLGRFEFKTKQARDLHFADLQKTELTPDEPCTYLADLWDKDGWMETKVIPANEVERVFNEPIAVIDKRGRDNTPLTFGEYKQQFATASA
jgi:hypothetical protein